MRHVTQWAVDIYIGENGRDTHAEARLHTQDSTVSGVGTSRRHPGEVDVPEIGDEYAVGRALIDLGRRLVALAIQDIEALPRPRTARGR